MDGVPGGVEAGIDTLPFEVAVVDAEGTVVAVNGAWREFADRNHGADPDYWVGANYFDVCRAADEPRFAVEALEGMRAVLDGEEDRYRQDYPCHSPDVHRWFQLDASRFTADGDPYLLVVHVDVTDRKLAELRAEARGDQLETVLGILTHDLRNPLNVIEGYTELLAADLGDDEAVDTIRQAVRRITEITDATLEFTRSGALADVEPLSTGAVAETAWRTVATGDATLVVAGSTRLHADRRLLLQLFENLFRNSVEHAGPGCTVWVGPLDDGFYVEDDGPGIPEAVRERAVGADYSTQGTGGLGLAIVQAIARAHGGRLVVTDADGGGARFELLGFEVAPSPPRDRERAPSSGSDASDRAASGPG